MLKWRCFELKRKFESRKDSTYKSGQRISRKKHRVEKKALKKRVAILEAEKTSGAKSPTSASIGGSSTSTLSTAAGTLTSSSAGSAAATAVTSSPATSGDSTIATTSQLISLATTTTVTPTTAITTTPSTAATSIGVSAASAPITVTSGGAETTVTSAITGTDMITHLFEAQTQLFAAQVQAATLPPLTNFEGQNAADDDDGFERWLEK